MSINSSQPFLLGELEEVRSVTCQVVGFLTVALLLGFLGVLGYVGYQIGYQRQPVSTVLDPLMGFLVFAGGATVVIGVMVGTGGTT